MRRRIRKREAVESDLLAIATHIAKDNKPAAIRFFEAAEDAFAKLRDMPGLGPQYGFRHPDLRDVRFWPIKGFRNYLIFYRAQADGIEVIRVLHGARNVERHVGRS